MKKFGKYLTITLLLLLGLICVGLLYLFFVPNSQLFGIKYVSLKDKHFSEAYDCTSINKVVVNTRAYDTHVVASSTDNISVMVYANNIGYLLVKNSDVVIDAKIDNSTLTFNITEPYGATILNESEIIISIPSSKTFDITISNDKANTSIGSNISINDLSYTTDKGNLSISNATITGEMNFKFNDAIISLDDGLILNNNNVNLSAGSGQFDAKDYPLGDIKINQNKRAVFLLNNANVINMNTSSAGGRIEAKSVGNISLVSTDTNVYIDTILDGASIILKDSGKVEIKSVDGAASITTDTGDIKINKSTSPLTLISKHGNIDVLDTTSKVDATNSYGNINVTFNDSALSNSVDNMSRLLIAENNKGKITCVGADRVDIKATNNARVNLSMHDVIGESNIVGANSNISVTISAEAQFLLTTEAGGKVSVNLSQISNVGTGGYTTGSHTETFINCLTSTNSLNITTNGNLTVRDTITTQLD